MLDKSFLEKLETLVKGNCEIIVDKDGKEYSVSSLKRVYDDPRPNKLIINSLDGLVDYVKSNVDNLDMEKLLIHVVDHQTVRLLTNVYGESNQRHTILVSELENFSKFPFDNYIGQESFIIKCGSMFQDTSDLASITRYTAKIDTEAMVTTEDDGITQIARIKQGSSGVSGERDSIPSKVALRPFRTFQELEQPKSEFLFRMKTEDSNAKCALFEADGGAWVRDARHTIAEYLKTNLSIDIPIIS